MNKLNYKIFLSLGILSMLLLVSGTEFTKIDNQDSMTIGDVVNLYNAKNKAEKVLVSNETFIDHYITKYSQTICYENIITEKHELKPVKEEPPIIIK